MLYKLHHYPQSQAPEYYLFVLYVFQSYLKIPFTYKYAFFHYNAIFTYFATLTSLAHIKQRNHNGVYTLTILNPSSTLSFIYYPITYRMMTYEVIINEKRKAFNCSGFGWYAFIRQKRYQ